MRIDRPLWAEGVFMLPQHFQQQASWEKLTNERVARMISAHPWGVGRVVMDSEALSIDRISVASIEVRMPDGTLIDTDISDRLPPARDLTGIPVRVNSVTALLGLPLIDAQGRNCAEGGRLSSRPRRYVREYLSVADINGEGDDEMSVERHALSLIFDFEETADYVTCPIARYLRNGQGRFDFDTSFVPPCLVLSANDRLTQRMTRLSSVLNAKSTSLAKRRRERSDQIADYAVADVSLFWLLHSVNSTWPELAELCRTPAQHPERLYGILARLAGSLLTFSTTETLLSIPPYNHRQLEVTFAHLETLIRHLLDAVIPSRVVPIILERTRSSVWTGMIHDERLAENADFYLAARAALPAHCLLEQLPRLCKAGAPDEVEQIVNSALPGIPLHTMSRLPAAVPIRIENQYFALDRAHPAFKRMLAARSCQFYIPTSIPEVELEFYAVLPV